MKTPSFQTTKAKKGVQRIFVGDIIIDEMRYLFSPTNRRVKVVLFILLGSIVPAFLFHTLAYTTLEKKLYKQENWREIYGDPPTWCVPAENPDLAVICGRAVTGKLTADERGNFLANLPIPNMTVEVWEQNPISPTGKLIGNLTNVFSSTTTNEDGRFQITMRKVGPPNKSVYLVFKCGKEAQKPKRLDSWHDYWNVVFQLGCTGSEEAEYVEPKLPYSFVDGSSFLGCNFDETEVVFTSMKKQEQPTVNDIVESKNFDHRHTQNQFSLTLSEAVPIIGPFLPTLDFNSPGGWWEADCLQKDELSILNDNASNGSVFQCNVLTACEWSNRAWTGFPSQYGPTGQPGSDNIVCDDEGIPGWGEADRLTKPFYPNIPKESTQAPYRRLDIRANLKDYSEERYLGAALTSRLWGSAITDPIGSPHVYLRSYLTESAGDFYVSCEAFRKAEAPYKTGDLNLPTKNKYLNGGPLGGLFPETTDKERIYNEVLSCDSTISDPTNPAYCDIRKPEDFVCNDYIRGRTEQENTAVRFCEIQPTFGENTHCSLDDPSCGGPCGTLGNVRYVLDREYFNIEQMFPNSDTANSMHSNVFNDSLSSTNYRQNENVLFNTEMQNQSMAFTGSTRAAAGGGNKVINGETRNGQKGNSLLTSESMASIERFVEGTETFADPLTAPFTNSKDDYEDLAVWKIYEIGTPATYCGIGDPWPHTGDFIDGPLQETLENIQPDNLFQGNTDTQQLPGQLRNRAISTSTWYMSEDAVDRDIALNEGGSVDPRFASRTIANLIDPFDLAEDPYLMGLGGNVGEGLDYALQLMPARDVFDSVLSMLQGDALLHEAPEDSAHFVINITDVVQAAVGIGDTSDIKVFGDRYEEQDMTPVPYYYVEHPLSEENFAFIPGVSEGVFVLPPFSEYADSTGYYGNPGTDGVPLMPNDWTSNEDATNACYPWNEIEEGARPCDSFREQYYGVSRTCRVDECKNYWLVETGTCSCLSPSNCWLSDSDNYELQDGDCNADDRLYCAREQGTTIRYRRGEDTEPEDMHIYPYPDSRYDHWEEEYKPTDRLDNSDCIDAGTDYDYTLGGLQTFSVTGDRGQTAHRCNVSRAGPMVGGGRCNGTLEIGDMALRLENRPPNPVPTTPEAETLDNSRTASLKLNNAFLPPFQPTTTGSYLGIMNGSHSDRKVATEGLYTYGAEIETAGYGNYNETSQYSTAPIAGNKNIPLTDLYYHCHLRGYTPILRGEVNMHPYIVAPWPYGDPDMGTVDDDGDGLYGVITDEEGNEVAADPMDDRSWLCTVLPTPQPEWVEYSQTSGGCAITDIGACLASPGVPDNLPPSYFDTVNMAANLAETPAAIIVAVMMSESGMIGGTTTPSNYWSDDFKVQMWGRPWYGRIDDGGASQCDDNVWSAQSPYQILKGTFELYMDIPAVIDTFEDLADGRSNSASRCNFLDASIIAAYHLKLHPGGVVPTRETMGDAGDCSGAYQPLIALDGYSGGIYDAGNTSGLLGVYSSCRR